MADPAYIDPATGVLTDPEAWVAVASELLDADTNSITFTSPADGSSTSWDQFEDLVAICYWASTATGAGYTFAYCHINGDSDYNNYSSQHLIGDGDSALAVYDTGTEWPLVIAVGCVKAVTSPSTISLNIFGGAVCTFKDINSGKYKSSFSQNAGDIVLQVNDSFRMGLTTRTWKSQAAVTSLQFKMQSGNLRDKSRIDLFGVLPRMTPGATTAVAT